MAVTYLPPDHLILDKALIRDALHPGHTMNGTGSWNAEKTYCSECNGSADGWHAGIDVNHDPNCPVPKKYKAVGLLVKLVGLKP